MAAQLESSTFAWLNRRQYPFQPHHLLVDGGRMHFVDEGNGDPILFVHGNPTWSYMWRLAITTFTREGRRCVAPDLIGFGLSEKPRDFSHTPAAHARNLAKLVQHLDLNNITLVAHELGGPIALSMAAAHPHRIKSLVLTNTWYWDRVKDETAPMSAKVAASPVGSFAYLQANAAVKSIKGMFGDKEKCTEEFCNAMAGPFTAKDAREGPYRLARQIVDEAGWFDELWMHREHFVSKPAQLHWGTKDPVAGGKVFGKAWHEMAHADVHDFPDAGAFLLEERPREVLSHMRKFMAGALNGALYVC